MRRRVQSEEHQSRHRLRARTRPELGRAREDGARGAHDHVAERRVPVVPRAVQAEPEAVADGRQRE